MKTKKLPGDIKLEKQCTKFERNQSNGFDSGPIGRKAFVKRTNQLNN